MGIISKSPTIGADDNRNSAPQNTAVGSGSRPTKGRVMIESSAPAQPQTLGRAPAGALK